MMEFLVVSQPVMSGCYTWQDLKLETWWKDGEGKDFAVKLFFFYNFNHRLALVKAMTDLCHFGLSPTRGPDCSLTIPACEECTALSHKITLSAVLPSLSLQDDMSDSLRDYTNLPEAAPLLTILDMSARAKYVRDVEEITPAVVEQFVGDFLAEKLKPEPI